jgi:beta-glucosidase/6-phospho-beta-glucosidase/beta-galactosidase
MKHDFFFATGIEGSYPTITGADGADQRIDEMEKCGHYRRWREDFALVKELGCPFLRYGPPYYRTHLGPDRYDWSFVDDTFRELERLRIVPIVDLLHFGLPDWMGDFQNPEFPHHFAAYAKALAARYPALRLYTPINEILITALFSAHYGWWNERLHSDRAFVTAIKHLCQANTLAMRAILEVVDHPLFIQNESSEYFHPMEPSCFAKASFQNLLRFVALDLTYGHPVPAPIYEYLLDNGMTRTEYHWFLENQVKTRCVMGTDYYGLNEHLVHPDGHWEPAGEIFGYYVITRQYHARYLLPVMHTETNVHDSDRAPQWLWKEWANLVRLKQDGVPVIGFTWYSLTDQVDWDSALRQDAGVVNPCGLYDLDRKIRPVGVAYGELIQKWHRILPTQSSWLHIDVG